MIDSARNGGLAIRAEGLGKRYRVGAREESYRTLRDSLSNTFAAPFRAVRTRFRGLRNETSDRENHIWALKDIAFQVHTGEAFAVIGPNGAGKSTLLKVLSRITQPTEGYVDVRGRVGALLEVGTGFHPELTGRDNIFLNGAILGMPNKEIQLRFDEIVEFAEVTRFLDTPVKRYSSGMQLRLAFAVAAHLEPDVLLADEVLAVGDAAFQRKCLGKMDQASHEGRTVLLVSHNMAAVRSLCTRAIVIQDGSIAFTGDAQAAVDFYLERLHGHDVTSMDTTNLPRPASIDAETGFRITSIAIGSDPNIDVIATGKRFEVTLTFSCERAFDDISCGFYVETIDGIRLIDIKSAPAAGLYEISKPGSYSVTGTIGSNPLAPGRYRLGAGVRDAQRGLDWIPHVLEFDVEETARFGSTWFEQAEGLFRSSAEWTDPQRVDPK